MITLGDRTAGSSANPRRIDAGAGIVVNLPRWIDMDPQGKPIDAVGVPPRVKIETRPEDFTGDRDPVLTAALEDVAQPCEVRPSGQGAAAATWSTAAGRPPPGTVRRSSPFRRRMERATWTRSRRFASSSIGR